MELLCGLYTSFSSAEVPNLKSCITNTSKHEHKFLRSKCMEAQHGVLGLVMESDSSCYACMEGAGKLL